MATRDRERPVDALLMHELREPLRHIEVFQSFLVVDEAWRLTGRGREYLDSLGGASRRLSDILDGWAIYRQIERTDLSLEWQALDEVCLRVFEAERVALDVEASIEIAGALGEIQADAVLLARLLRELFRNALMYRAATRRATIRIDRDDRRRVWIGDNGIGVSDGQLPRLFEPFTRQHTESHHRGTGLGLAMVECVARRHGWTVEAGTTDGNGGLRISLAFPA